MLFRSVVLTLEIERRCPPRSEEENAVEGKEGAEGEGTDSRPTPAMPLKRGRSTGSKDKMCAQKKHERLAESSSYPERQRRSTNDGKDGAYRRAGERAAWSITTTSNGTLPGIYPLYQFGLKDYYVPLRG